MDERKYLKEVIDHPTTRGEQDQAARLKKFSSDSGEIIAMRSKLRGLMDDLVDDEERLRLQQDLIAGSPIFSLHQRRSYDRSILLKSPSSAFLSLFSYFSLRRLFRRKYGLNGKVAWSFWSFFAGGDLFWPSMQVYRHVQKVMVLMEELREPVRRMYALGWLGRSGADVLSPLDFNLLGELERLTGDASILGFLLDIRKPKSAVRKLNPFLGYYFSLTRNGVYADRLVEAVRMSQRRIVNPDASDTRQIERLVAAIRQLLSADTDRDFVVPLFECVYYRTFTDDEVRSLVRLEDVDEISYTADPQLIEAMAVRKKKYQERLREAIIDLGREIGLVSAIHEARSRRVAGKHGLLDMIDYQLFYLNNQDNESFRMKKNNIAQCAADACEVFAYAFEPLLVEGVYLRFEQDRRFVALFKGLFDAPVETIKRESRIFLEYVRKGYGWPLLNKKVFTREELIFANALCAVNDAFYRIGETLFDVMVESSLPESSTGPLTVQGIGQRTVPGIDRVILAAQTPAHNRYTVALKTVRDALREVQDFCFTFSARFEWAARDFSQTARAKSIAEMTGSVDSLRERLARMERGELDDLP